MASLRTQSAARILRGATASRVALAAASRRFQGGISTSSGTVPAVKTNEPDYDLQADKASSYILPN